MKRKQLYMKIYRSLFAVLLGSALLLNGCISPVGDYRKFATPLPQTGKQLAIPRYERGNYTGMPFMFWHYAKQKEKQLGLVPAESSPDSLLFRMWVTNQNNSSNQAHGLLEIRSDSAARWKGQLILMWVDYSARELSETIRTSERIELSPMKSDWKTIIDSLLALGIAELPSDEKIPDYYS